MWRLWPLAEMKTSGTETQTHSFTKIPVSLASVNRNSFAINQYCCNSFKNTESVKYSINQVIYWFVSLHNLLKSRKEVNCAAVNVLISGVNDCHHWNLILTELKLTAVATLLRQE